VKRRKFIALMGGAATWPLAVRAQQPAMPVIGVLARGTPDTEAGELAPFLRGLRDTGYVEGQNVTIDSLERRGA
jgi:putative ABC transport system substrate-binding protein